MKGGLKNNTLNEKHVFFVPDCHKLEYSPSATRRSFQKRVNASQGLSPMTIHTQFKFQKRKGLGDELVASVDLKQTVITPQNFATVSNIVKKF